MKYINKKDCENLGFIRLKDGTIYRQTVLEKYHKKGWLDFGSSRYSADDRLTAGCRLAQDYYNSHFATSGVTDYAMPRVDNSAKNDISPAVMDARSRYLSAMAKLDRPQLYVVRIVCCEDREIKIPKINSSQYNHDLELLKENLSRGLDVIIEHYWGKIYYRRPQITGYSFWDNVNNQELEK